MRLTEKYTGDQFEQKITPWVLAMSGLVILAMIVLTIFFPVWLLAIPAIAAIGLIIFIAFWGIAYAMLTAVKKVVELFCGEEFS